MNKLSWIGFAVPTFASLSLLLFTTAVVAVDPEAGNRAAVGPALERAAPSPLLAIDQNRRTVVDRIVGEWGEALARTDPGIDAAQLREMLNGMRADQLLAASLAGSLEGLRNVVAAAFVTDAAVKPSLQAKALGDADKDVVYVPVTPCRLVETRGNHPAVYQGDGTAAHTPIPFTTNEIRTYTLQGGNGVCLTQLPASLTPSAVQMQVYGISTTGAGDIEILPQGGTFGSTATMVYGGSTVGFVSTAATSVVNLANKQISVQVRGPGSHVVIDVVGYFRAPAGGFVSSVTAGTGLTGGGTGAVTLNVDTTTIQSRVTGTCPAGSSIRVINANGTVSCETDDVGTGTVTSLSQGTGITLSSNPITTTGSIAVNTTTIQARVTGSCAVGNYIRAIASDGTVTCGADNAGPANAYVQNGNAFGAVGILGTTDNFALDVRVNNARVMRYEPNAISPNVIGGSPANNVTAGVRGATIGGGGVPSGDPDPNFPFDAPNRVTDAYGTVGGGYANVAGDDAGTVFSAPFATVGGGFNSRASGFGSTVGGGQANVASGVNSTVAGGDSNVAGANATVSGGFGNTASGSFATVGGGLFNIASGDNSWAGGSHAKTESGDAIPITYDASFIWADNSNFDFRSLASQEFAARATGGFRFVTAINGSGVPTRVFRVQPTGAVGVNLTDADPIDATLVVHDATPTMILRGNAGNTSSRLRFEEIPPVNDCAGGYIFHDGTTNFFEIGVNNGIATGPCTPADDLRAFQIHRSTGRVGVLTTFVSTPTHPLTVGNSASNGNGAHVTAGGVWTNGSSRTFKENFVAVDGEDMLSRVLALPIASWSYRGSDERHIGPVAEDFKAAFGVGGDERYIGTVDAEGVALAAIQGLNAKVESQAREIAELRRALHELRTSTTAR